MTHTSTSGKKKFNQTFGFYCLGEGKDVFNLTLNITSGNGCIFFSSALIAHASEKHLSYRCFPAQKI